MSATRGRPIYAKLVGHEVVVCPSLAAWRPWADEHFEHGDGKSRQVRLDEFEKEHIAVSTVFIGINQALHRDEPGWFETMIFCDDDKDPLDHQRLLSSTWDEAERGHAKVVAEVMAELLRRGGRT